jgi:hypothetical protein
MYTGEKLRPSHNSVVRHGDRYFNITEQVVDTHPEWNESMKEAEKELKNPVKNFDKLKTLYDKVKKAEDDETRETMIHSSLLPSKSPRSFTYRRNSNPYSHIPNEFMYRKPYDDDDDGDAYRTPAKTRGENEYDNVLLQSITEKKPTSRLFNGPSSSMRSFAPTLSDPDTNRFSHRIDFPHEDGNYI